MAEARPGPESEKTIWEAATDKKIRRQLAFLELASIPSAELEPKPIETFEDTGFFLAPLHVYCLLRKMYIGAYLPEPGYPVVDIQINGLAGPGYYTPLATEEPTRGYLRRTTIPGNDLTDANRQLGVVFQFDCDNPSRLVTAEAECGLALFPSGFRVYRRSRILVNHLPHIMEPTCLYRCNVAAIDEFLANIQGLIGETGQPTVLKELPGPRAPKDDTMPLHDDTPPPPEND